MSDTERVIEVKTLLVSLCEKLQELASEDIQIEFAITDCKLTKFVARKPMKIES